MENATRATRNPSGRLAMKSDAAALAAVRRSGETSVASIEREVSMVSTTVASSRGTGTTIDGRASAIPRTAIAAR